MYELGSHRSTIREIFEYGNQRAAIVGRENVLDFSLGNPNVPAPDEVRQAILALSPIVTPGQICTPMPIQTLLPMVTAFAYSSPSPRRRASKG